MVTKHIPTFTLKGVDPIKLMTDYNSGYFTIDRPIASKIKLVEEGAIIAPIYGSSNSDAIFSIKDKNNSNIVIATSGHDNFEHYFSNGGQMPVGGRCDACKRDFKGPVVGYPVKFEIKHILINNPNNPDDPDDGLYRVIYIFWVEGEFCSFEHALYYVRKHHTLPYKYRDCNLRDSENLLKLLYRLKFPRAGELYPCNDPRLLKSHRGSLTDEQWENKNLQYEDTHRLHIIPVKREYIQQLCNHPITSSSD